MKKLTSIFAGLFLLFTASAFTTTDANVSSKIQSVFQQDFSTVSEVKWTAYEDIYVASFKDKDNSIAAAYSSNGELLCVGKSISAEQLPAKVSRALQAKYAGYAINPEIVEVTTTTTSYVMYAENDKYKLRLSADASGNITVQEKTKK